MTQNFRKQWNRPFIAIPKVYPNALFTLWARWPFWMEQ